MKWCYTLLRICYHIPWKVWLHKELFSTVDPCYVDPGCEPFSKTVLPQLYSESREYVEKEHLLVSYFATNADLWSSCTRELYISVAVHFINSGWGLKSKCLSTAYFPEDLGGELIAQGLTDWCPALMGSEWKQPGVHHHWKQGFTSLHSNWTRLQCSENCLQFMALVKWTHKKFARPYTFNLNNQ